MKKFCKLCTVLTVSLGMVLNANIAFADNNDLLDISKIYGNNRFLTAAKVSEDGWGYSNYVIIANGYGFADALCSAPLSKTLDAPVLLTEKNGLPIDTKKEIERLGARKAYIIGGTGVVGTAVENQLKNMGITITRLSGSDRYETSLAVAKEINKVNVIKDVVVASGEQITMGIDALSIAPIAGNFKMPILLSPKNGLTNNVKRWVNNKHIHASYVIGGPGALSDIVLRQAPNSKRIGGRNRYETNREVLEQFGNYLDFNNVFLAKAENSAVIDALTAGPYASRVEAPLVLVGNDLDLQQQKFLAKYKPAKLKAVGGQLKDETVLRVGRLLNTEIATAIKKVTINDKRRITIEFNGILNGYQASQMKNFYICGSMIQQATVQPDYRTVVLRLKYDLDKSALLNLEGQAQNVLGKGLDITFNKSNTNIEDNVSDEEKPRVDGVEVLDTVEEGGNRILVKFSEKVREGDARRIDNYYITDKNANKINIEQVVFNSEREDEVILITESLEYAGRYSININGIRDLADNVMEGYETYIDIFDTGAVKIKDHNVEKSSSNSSRDVELIFNKKLDKASAEKLENYKVKLNGRYLNYSIGTVKFNDIARDRVIVSLIGLPQDGTYALEVRGVKDLSGENILLRTDVDLGKLMVEKPKVIDSDVRSYGVYSKIILTFNQELTKAQAEDKSNYVIQNLDQAGTDVSISKIEYGFDGDESKVTIYLNEKLEQNETYSIRFGNIKNIEGYGISTSNKIYELLVK